MEEKTISAVAVVTHHRVIGLERSPTTYIAVVIVMNFRAIGIKYSLLILEKEKTITQKLFSYKFLATMTSVQG